MLGVVQWIAMAVLAAIAALAVLTPLFRSRHATASADAALAIYRDQIEELAADRERGLIGQAEAEAARAEIGRRILRASEERAEIADAVSGRRIGVASAIAIPLVALGLYLGIGAPNMPDMPLASRDGGSELMALVAEVERHLAGNPDDARGWEVLAPAYLRLGRFDGAADAFRNLIRLRGSNAEWEASLGEALTRVNGGLVTEEAEAAFRRANAADPSAVRPRYYLALALSQDGDPAAAEAWRALLAAAPAENAPWVVAARAELARAEAGVRAPDRAAVEAAAGMDAAERGAMIEGMVASLAERLKSEPGDAEGWARLVRSYMVLGRHEEARAALGEGRAALAENEAGLALVEAEARSFGLAE